MALMDITPRIMTRDRTGCSFSNASQSDSRLTPIGVRLLSLILDEVRGVKSKYHDKNYIKFMGNSHDKTKITGQDCGWYVRIRLW